MSSPQNQRLEIECFLLAGKLLMQSGAETFRVEDTMRRMAISQGYTDAVSYATATGVFFSAGHDTPTRIVHVTSRSFHLDKISRINDISRKLTSHQLTVEEAYEALLRIEASGQAVRPAMQIFFAAMASGSFVLLFQGGLNDIPVAVFAGGFGYIFLLLVQQATKIKFFAEFISSLVIGCTAAAAVHFGLGIETDKIIISAVMPLVPGVAITNALRDLIAGHMVSGVSKGIEAFLTALCIGSGIAVALSFM